MTRNVKLPDPAAGLFNAIRDALDRHLTPITPGRSGWTLTGGTALAAVWQHRESTDIDIVVHPKTEIRRLAKTRDSAFWNAMREAGATDMELEGTRQSCSRTERSK